MNGRIILLDAGTGLAGFAMEENHRRLTLPTDILLGHLHLDHIIGLPAFHALYKPNNIRIFTKSRNDTPLAAQVFGVFKPPYWPVDFAEMNHAELVEIKGPFNLSGSVRVIPFASDHPNETTAFRIEGEKTVVYLLDSETTENSPGFDALISFCDNADLMIFDAAYLPGDYNKKRGWGHSTFEAGITLADAAECKQIIFSHFDYSYNDEVYDYLMEKIDNERFYLAYDGMEIID
jgi:ribonuclease BN (tRNA processing enzyme)